MKPWSLVGRALAAALIAFPLVVQAQFPGGGGASPGGGSRGGMQRGNAGEAREAAAAHTPDVLELLQIQLAELEEDLKLTAAQRGGWALYSERVRQLAGDLSRNRLALRFPKGTAPQQFDFIADALRNRLTALEDIADAGKSLYAQLTPDQREIADRRLARVIISLVDAGQVPGGGVVGPPAASRGSRPPP